MLTFATFSSKTQLRARISFMIPSMTDFATRRSSVVTVKLRSVTPSWLVFCTTVSTRTPASLSGWKIPAAAPGRSGTALIVILAMSLS